MNVKRYFCLLVIIFLIITSKIAVSLDKADITTILFPHEWKGNIDKIIEFFVYGEQPYNYTDYSSSTPERICEIKNYDDYSSYTWQWENERIVENYVRIDFEIPRDKPFTFLVGSDLVFVMISIVISSFIVFKLGFQRKKKEVSK